MTSFWKADFLFGMTLLFVIFIGCENVNGEEEQNEAADDGQKQPRHILFKDKYAKKGENDRYKCHTFPDGREFCGCLGETDWKPQKFVYPAADFNDCDNFNKVAMMSICGNEWFDQIKLCALTQFFEDKNPEDAISDEQMGFVQYKRALILLDGCVTSTHDEGCNITSLQLSYDQPAKGGFLSSCYREPKVLEYEMNPQIIVTKGREVSADCTSFTLPVPLSQRSCNQFFSTAAKDDYYDQLQLKIYYKCGGTLIDFPINLPKFELKEYKYSVGEIRGIRVHLDKEGDSAQQYRLKEDSEDFDFVLNKDEFKWEDGHVECWLGEGKCAHFGTA